MKDRTTDVALVPPQPSSAQRQPTVCILGAALDVGNRGVLALAVSLAELITQVRPDARLHFHYGNVTGGLRRLPNNEGSIEITVLNCRLSPRSKLAEHILFMLALAVLYRLGLRAPARRNPWLRSMLDADFVGDITGGDSFSDIYGLRRFVDGSLPLLTALVLGRPYAMLPQTYGPFRHPLSRLLARQILKHASVVLTRDRNCLTTVEELSGKRAIFCPDVAFGMRTLRPSRARFLPEELALCQPALLIGLNVSGLLYMGGYTQDNMFGLHSEYRELIDQLVERLLGSTSATLLLVPHVFGTEREEEATLSLFRSASAKYPGRVFALAEPLSEREIKWVIGQTHFFVGSRMHACIAALSQGVPAVALAYSDKFKGVFESAGVGDAVVDLRSTPLKSVIDATMTALERRDDLRQQLGTRIPQIRRAIVRTLGDLFVASAMPSVRDRIGVDSSSSETVQNR